MDGGQSVWTGKKAQQVATGALGSECASNSLPPAVPFCRNRAISAS